MPLNQLAGVLQRTTREAPVLMKAAGVRADAFHHPRFHGHWPTRRDEINPAMENEVKQAPIGRQPESGSALMI
jgi:hypothetical protein